MSDNLYDKLSQERKELQAQGLVPEWYTTAGWQMFKSKYMYATDKAVKGQFERIAKQQQVTLKELNLNKMQNQNSLNYYGKVGYPLVPLY